MGVTKNRRSIAVQWIGGFIFCRDLIFSGFRFPSPERRMGSMTAGFIALFLYTVRRHP